MAKQKALYVDGDWVATSDTVVKTNPSDTSEVIGEYAQATSDHVTLALAAANRAVGEWGVSPVETRYQVLMAIGNELIERSLVPKKGTLPPWAATALELLANISDTKPSRARRRTNHPSTPADDD